MAGDTVIMPTNAMMMIHNPWTLAIGDSVSMRKTADLLDQIKGSIVTTYKSKVDMDDGEIAALMDAETWFDAQGAMDAGLATAITGKAEGKTKKEAMRALKRRISDAVYHQLLVDATCR